MRNRKRRLVLESDRRQPAFDYALPKARQLREELRTARKRDCLIPSNDRDGPCSPELNNSHLIGEGHLYPIAKSGYVYEWDATDIGNIATQWMLYGSTLEDTPYRVSVGRWKPSNVLIKRCTRRFACKNHDGPVFEGIDAAKLDIGLGSHQFLLGFRAAAGTLALYESVLDFVQSLHRPKEADFWKQRDQWKELQDSLEDRLEAVRGPANELRRYMARWQEVYLDRENRGDSVIVSTRTFHPAIRVACSSIYRTIEGPQYTLTILPSRDGTEATAMVSTLKGRHVWSHFTGDRLLKRDADHICVEVTTLLQRDPEVAVAHLAQKTHHFLVNKSDYDNDAIISNRGRESIERRMAELSGTS